MTHGDWTPQPEPFPAALLDPEDPVLDNVFADMEAFLLLERNGMIEDEPVVE